MTIKIAPKEVTPRKKVTLSLKAPIVEQIELYAKYLGGNTDKLYVVEQILEAFFRQEKDFNRWLNSQHQTGQPRGTL